MRLQETFEFIAKNNIKRDGILDLLQYLKGTNFYTAPASSKYHGAQPEGLVTHSLKVYERLKHLYTELIAGQPLSDGELESITIVALFHDICKADYYVLSTRNVKNEKTGQWEKVPFYKVEEKFPFGGHGSKSMYLIQHFMSLNPDEATAINCHMGAWDKSDYGNPSPVYETNVLAWLLHVADEMATYVDKT